MANSETEIKESTEATGITPEKLKSLQTLETTIEGNFGPALGKINADFGTDMASRPDGFHMTIIGPTESKALAGLTQDQIQEVQKINEAIQRGEGISIAGIGFIDGSTREGMRAADKEKKTCFLAVECPAMQEFRKSLGLPEKDLHITLGFEKGDIHMEVSGKDAKGKDILKPIPKKADPSLDDYLVMMPEIKLGGLDGQEKQKAK